ncbi:hypothetical protein ASV15_20060 [Enterobacter hormaechei subsp. steigerwaltii]|uniref:hypothetical protein n=1 Tax=Enterobacter hormaechei TaxID=158836 RepID=UPI000735CD71|nr:hypothetical protein [Enterobacter hormaechei]KTH84926.1 hypothetical protein ASV15_20060 [Enterobacter hormaechei subsp. steigerwaltii]
MFERFLKKEGFVIAVSTLIIYAATYFYERGYCSALNIPFDYIEISIPTIVNDFIIFFVLLLPVAYITIAIMLRAEKNSNKGSYALASLLCGLVYSVLLFYFVEKTIQSALLCLFMGGLYFVLITFKSSFKEDDTPLRAFSSTSLLIGMAALLFSFTFIVIGKSIAEDGSFQTYVKNDKEYILLKVYGENAFMREINKGKPNSDVVYFNTKDMTGMTIKADD